MLTKNYIYRSIISFSILIGLCGCMVSKESAPIGSIQEKKSYCELKKFSAKYANGKVYVNWLVNTNNSNYYFVLEKSTGSEFTVIHIRKGFSSPIFEGLSYSYIDNNLTATLRTYRLRAVQSIKNGEEILLYTNNKNLFKNFENAMIIVSDDNTKIVSK